MKAATGRRHPISSLRGLSLMGISAIRTGRRSSKQTSTGLTRNLRHREPITASRRARCRLQCDLFSRARHVLPLAKRLALAEHALPAAVLAAAQATPNTRMQAARAIINMPTADALAPPAQSLPIPRRDLAYSPSVAIGLRIATAMPEHAQRRRPCQRLAILQSEPTSSSAMEPARLPGPEAERRFLLPHRRLL